MVDQAVQASQGGLGSAVDRLFAWVYLRVAIFLGVSTFVLVWAAAIYSNWIVGAAIGWIPAAMAGAIAYIIGPLVLFIGVTMAPWIAEKM